MEGFQLSKSHKQAFSQIVLEIDFNGIHLVDVAEIPGELQSDRILCRTLLGWHFG